jgi:hypothetical protein
VSGHAFQNASHLNAPGHAFQNARHLNAPLLCQVMLFKMAAI